MLFCTPAKPDWIRKQKIRGYGWFPRKFARLQWCAVPIELDGWDKHYKGPKGTGPYRNRNACVTSGAVSLGPVAGALQGCLSTLPP